MVIRTSANELDKRLRTSEGFSLLDFTAPWCAPCKRLDPVVQAIAEKTSNLKVFSINVDEEPDLAGKFGVRSVPNLVLVKDGNPIAVQVGYVSENEVRTWLAGYGI
jgi:thioredoxin 1